MLTAQSEPDSDWWRGSLWTFNNPFNRKILKPIITCLIRLSGWNEDIVSISTWGNTREQLPRRDTNMETVSHMCHCRNIYYITYFHPTEQNPLRAKLVNLQQNLFCQTWLKCTWVELIHIQLNTSAWRGSTQQLTLCLSMHTSNTNTHRTLKSPEASGLSFCAFYFYILNARAAELSQHPRCPKCNQQYSPTAATEARNQSQQHLPVKKAQEVFWGLIVFPTTLDQVLISHNNNQPENEAALTSIRKSPVLSPACHATPPSSTDSRYCRAGKAGVGVNSSMGVSAARRGERTEEDGDDYRDEQSTKTPTMQTKDERTSEKVWQWNR